MGQKLSDLRDILSAMENDVNNDDSGNASCMKNNNELAYNGNVGETKHFEAIYSTRNEASGSTSADENNGNACSENCEGAVVPFNQLQCACNTSSRANKRRDDSSKKKGNSVSSSRKTRTKRSKDRSGGMKKRGHWGLKLNCAKLKNDADLPDSEKEGSCVCTGYRRTSDYSSPSTSSSSSSNSGASPEACSCSNHRRPIEFPPPPVIDLARFNPDDFPIEDCDERARLERAREIAEGVEAPPGFVPELPVPASGAEFSIDRLALLVQSRLGLQALSALSHLETFPTFQRLHSQADFIHCLVPDLLEITLCSFYWGKMDRFEAERLLEGRPEGSFLLRDSAQEEHLFSVTFIKYGRSLHARIEQWNHRFSFDSHDPGVYSSPTVLGLIEHYKDPSFCMFFEPMLTIPLNRTFPFPLQHLCRASICSITSYDAINRLHLPRPLKQYLREYHYKQRVRVRYMD